MTMETDTLNTLVSAAIWRAEQLEAHGINAGQAWVEVSSLEGALAKALPISEPEGRIARRGAVRAALKARDYGRADMLAEGYMAEEVAPESLKASLLEMLEEDAEGVAIGYQYAAKRHTLREARHLARRFNKTGPFGLAAA